ncbi:CHRD domain-containing protein [Noviherbaspirillum massiliense]|uniref:CHRD domain-containing protein n=1 Tax=Noviherbaspirillum massiliense TaxID=1465823 RepID=UPI00030AECDD|nr:CHRD domain-containing protein [Noviherbaspirillum massiliense]
MKAMISAQFAGAARYMCFSLLLGAVLLLAACGGGHDDLPQAFSTMLTGNQVVPATGSAASADGLLTYEPDSHTLTASVIANGVAATAVQLREGRPGSNGPLVLALASESSTGGTGIWSARAGITHTQLSSLQAGNFYLEVQSAAFPAGEIRGQVQWEFPSGGQIERLKQWRQQSLTIELQLQQLRRIAEDDHDHVRIGLLILF